MTHHALKLATLGALAAACGESQPPRPASVGSVSAELTINEHTQLLASDGSADDAFGNAVGVSGDTIVLGAPGDTEAGANAGAAYTFDRAGSTWTQGQKLFAGNTVGWAFFGTSTAIEGSTLAIGSHGQDTNRGEVYVFTRGATWSLEDNLRAGDEETGNDFGSSVALSGDTIVAGAGAADFQGNNSGAAYVFVRSGTTWSQQQKLLPAEVVADDQFGASVSISGDTLVVGAPTHDAPGADSGAAWIYTRSGMTWSLQQKLAPGPALSQFGSAVSVSGDTAIIGATEDDSAASNAGAAYVYTRSGSTWTQAQQLVAGDAFSNDRFGASIALSGGAVVIGAPEVGSTVGAAYVFTESAGTWTERVELNHSSPSAQDTFSAFVDFGVIRGSSVAIDADTAVVGARNRDDNGSNSGAAYVFALEYGQACSSGAQCASGSCRDGFCCDRPCTGACETCDAALGATENGICSNRSAGDPGSPSCAPLACNGAEADCPSACSSDSHCQPASHCEASACVPDLSQGAACGRAAQCPGDRCVDGVCCDTDCTAVCQACAASKTGGVDGTCADVSAGGDSDGDCAAEPASTCGTTGTCDGSGGCEVHPLGTICAAASCPMEGVEASADTCDGAGTCVDNGTMACSPSFACVGGACQTTCASDTDCVAAAYCSGASCVPDEPDGAACSDPGHCQSGFCVDGVCCESLCDGTCVACSAAVKGVGADGVCGNIAAGADPEDECAEDQGFPASCLSDGNCDGNGACRTNAPNTTPCGATTCEAGGVQGLLCNGAGQCLDSPATPCDPYLCMAGACLTTCATDAECATNAFCSTVAGVCLAKQSNGASCGTGTECESGLCVDGVCCNDACTGQCEACDVAPNTGSCSPVVGDPRGTRPPCAADDAQCAGACDGTDRSSCTYPGGEQSCGTASCEDNVASSSSCDGRGGCAANADVSCRPFACGTGATCLTICNDDNDCSTGNRCDVATGECVASTGVCVESNTAVEAVDGTVTSCSPYLCVAGRCEGECSTSNDCASGHVCDTTQTPGACVERQSGKSDDDGGCGCRAAGTPRPPTPTWLALGLAVFGLSLRRRSRPRARSR